MKPVSEVIQGGVIVSTSQNRDMRHPAVIGEATSPVPKSEGQGAPSAWLERSSGPGPTAKYDPFGETVAQALRVYAAYVRSVDF